MENSLAIEISKCKGGNGVTCKTGAIDNSFRVVFYFLNFAVNPLSNKERTFTQIYDKIHYFVNPKVFSGYVSLMFSAVKYTSPKG